MFASRSLWLHLAKGFVGFGALTVGVVLGSRHLWALALVPVGLIALRGCPLCWTLGLVETVVARLRGARADGACVDGACSLGKPEPD